MKLVVIESPYAGEVLRNIEYAKHCLRDSISRNEAPYASHLLYPLVLDDNNSRDRSTGIALGMAWHYRADLIAFYTDYGFSAGMTQALAHVQANNFPFEIRTIL